MKKAIFLDKDGTLIHDIPYNVDTSLIRWNDGVFESLRLLKDRGYLLIVVSNQSGIAHGYFTEREMMGVMEKMYHDLVEAGARLDGFYFCPHHPDGVVADYAKVCHCRKPAPGMILQAADDFNIDLSQSWMIGDILNDIEAGNNAGCKTILINNGNETEWITTEERTPDFTVHNIKEAVEKIFSTQDLYVSNEQ